MFIDISDEEKRTRNLQMMLRYLSIALSEPGLEVFVSGVFGNESENAVKYYQQTRGLPVTGIVDLETWDSIASEYKYELALRSEVKVYPTTAANNFQTSPGERSDTVLILQLMLNALEFHYGCRKVRLSGTYGLETVEAVRCFQKKNGLDETGVADRRTWQKISEEYNALYFD